MAARDLVWQFGPCLVVLSPVPLAEVMVHGDCFLLHPTTRLQQPMPWPCAWATPIDGWCSLGDDVILCAGNVQSSELLARTRFANTLPCPCFCGLLAQARDLVGDMVFLPPTAIFVVAARVLFGQLEPCLVVLGLFHWWM